MKAFDDLFHAKLHSLSPSNDAKLQEVQRSYGSSPTVLTAALDMQDAIMNHMKRIATIQGDAFTDDDIDPRIMAAELHNPQQQQCMQPLPASRRVRGPRGTS